MVYVLEDNTIVEVTSSDVYAGPNRPQGTQRVSKNAMWYKINNGKWELSPYRTDYQLFLEIRCSKTINQLKEKLKYAALGIA